MCQVEHVLTVGNHLGESPIWDVREQVLYWVDINGHSFHRYVPATGQVETFDVGLEIGCIAFRALGGFVVATEKGFAYWDFQTQHLHFIADPEPGKPDARFNDGKVDRQGRFWAGTVAPGATSSLYRLDPDCSVHTMETGITVSNGIGWSPDDRTLYLTDSRRHVIYAYDFDAATGDIANRRNWVLLPDDEPGVPDGLAVDSEGFVWSARWDGWKVCRYDPAGKLECEIPMPVQRPTSCAFGRAGLDTLYITSARSPRGATQSKGRSIEGDLFCLRLPVRGIAEHAFAG